MAESSQDLLRSAWLEGKDGGLPGREQAKAWALREVWRDAGKADHGTGLAMNTVTQFSCEQEALGSSRVLNTASRRTCAHGGTNPKRNMKSAQRPGEQEHIQPQAQTCPGAGPEHKNEHEDMPPNTRTLYLASPAAA